MATTRSKSKASGGLEAAVLDAFPFLVDALGLSALGLLVPSSLPIRPVFVVQLALLSFFALFLSYRLLRHLDRMWFPTAPVTDGQRNFGTALAAIVIVTGVTGLVTIASSAALRFEASTQFLQVLSALDIAWAASTVMVAAYMLWRNAKIALAGGAIVVVMCLGVLARYVDQAAFGPKGGWKLRATTLWEYVLPYDIGVAIIAIVLLFFAVRRPQADA